MTDDSISNDLQGKLMKLIVTSGEKNPEETVILLFKAAMDVLRRAFPVDQDKLDPTPSVSSKFPRETPSMSPEGFEILTEQFMECANEASGYSPATFVGAGIHGMKKADGGVASLDAEALLKHLVHSGVDPIWAARSLVNSATKFALIQKLDKPLMTHILLSGIRKMNEPTATLDVTSIIEKMGAERGLSKEDALKEFAAMMETFGG